MKQPSVAVCSNHLKQFQNCDLAYKEKQENRCKASTENNKFLMQITCMCERRNDKLICLSLLKCLYSSHTPVVSNNSQYFVVFVGFCFKEAGWELQRESPWHLLSVTHEGALWGRLSGLTILVLCLVCLFLVCSSKAQGSEPLSPRPRAGTHLHLFTFLPSVVQTGLEVTVYPRMSFKLQQSSCLQLQSTRIVSLSHHARPSLFS